MQKEQLYQFLINPGLLNSDTVEILKKLTEEFPWFQLAYILYAKNLKQIESVEYDVVLKNVAIRVPNRKLLFRYLNSDTLDLSIPVKNETPFSLTNDMEHETDGSVGNSLIDKFLINGTGSIRNISGSENHSENESRIEILEKSTTETDELITETLAGIYFQQKKYEKAINAYQKLSLKYPEKSVYFASRIKEIEDIKNNN